EVGGGRGLLYEDGGADECRERAQSGDREVLDRSGGLCAVQGVRGDRYVTECVAFATCRHAQVRIGLPNAEEPAFLDDRWTPGKRHQRLRRGLRESVQPRGSAGL